MLRLNYFEPFQSKSSGHEDQLTRAYLVVLRFSPTALLMFYELISRGSNKLPPISEVQLDNIQFDTQKTNIEKYLASKVLSVLLTDKQFKLEQKVENSEREARYDGIIRFSDELLIIIENKPKSINVWEDQLSPNLKNQSNEIELISEVVLVEWKEIIGTLNSLVSMHSISGSERMMITDFLDYVNRHFSFLNPYDNLALCKNDYHLINQRLESILEQISANGEVGYQPKWRSFYLETGLEGIRMVVFGVEMLESENKYNLQVGFYFGDTQHQSRKFYESNIPYQKIEDLKSLNWTSRPNFHISYMQAQVVGFNTPNGKSRDYYEYWLNNQNEIYQRKQEDLSNCLEKLSDLDIIKFDAEKRKEVNDKVLETNRDRLNLCPGFVLTYSINSNDAIEMDNKKELVDFIKEKVRNGLSILDKELLFLEN